MAIILQPFKSQSHPGVPLNIHLVNVANACEKYIMQMTNDNKLHKIAFVIGLLHDIGKSTIYFQDYMLRKKCDDAELKKHSHIGALIVYSIVNQMFDDDLYARYAYLAVKRHHGDLLNISSEFSFKSSNEKIDILLKQLNAINIDELTALVSLINDKYNTNIVVNAIIDEFNTDLKIKNFCRYSNRTYTDNEDNYLNILSLYSALLLADKSDVIFDEKVKPEKPNTSWMTQYRIKHNFNKPNSEIDAQKEFAYNSIIDNIEKNLDSSKRIYSLTLPTGLGKTFSALGAALKIIEKDPTIIKIVNAIPFTSIIDQSFGVYTDVIGDCGSNVLLKHHHLAEITYVKKTNAGTTTITDIDEIVEEKFDSNKSKFLIETWESGFVVTTFVQLFESLLTNNKQSAMKLPNITNSILLLDEIQNINYDKWKLINFILTQITKRFNCYIILLTATQPLIFEKNVEITELVPNYDHYYKLFNRTKLLMYEDSFPTISSFVEEIQQYAIDNPKENILVMMNSKRNCNSAFNLFRFNNLHEKVYYITTLITPNERKKVIKVIENKDKNGKIKKRKKRIIVFSTQVLEAGVDVSFDTAFREIAPLDSILQAAGRVNRYNTAKVPGKVFIYKFGKDFNYAELIYGTHLIAKTRTILERVITPDGYEEKDYLNIIEQYYHALKEKSDNVNNPMVNNIKNIEFESIGNFRYIVERIDEIGIFVILNEKARRLFNKYRKLYNDDTIPFFEKKSKFNDFKNKFYDYVIYVNSNEMLNLVQDCNFYIWDYKNPSDNYVHNPTDMTFNSGYNSLNSIII